MKNARRTFSQKRVLEFYRSATRTTARHFDVAAVLAEARQAYNEGQRGWEVSQYDSADGTTHYMSF